MTSLALEDVRPPIMLAETDAKRLEALALRMEQSSPLAADLLLEELERAEVFPDRDLPQSVVRMYSTVEFVDDAHDSHRTVQLVYPQEADISTHKVSVLTPVGAGLVGMSPGQTILWPDRDGTVRSLRILSVSAPAAG